LAGSATSRHPDSRLSYNSSTMQSGTRSCEIVYYGSRSLMELRVIGDSIALCGQRQPHLVINVRFPPNFRR
jgi:hypothetical protein